MMKIETKEQAEKALDCSWITGWEYVYYHPRDFYQLKIQSVPVTKILSIINEVEWHKIPEIMWNIANPSFRDSLSEHLTLFFKNGARIIKEGESCPSLDNVEVPSTLKLNEIALLLKLLQEGIKTNGIRWDQLNPAQQFRQDAPKELKRFLRNGCITAMNRVLKLERESETSYSPEKVLGYRAVKFFEEIGFGLTGMVKTRCIDSDSLTLKEIDLDKIELLQVRQIEKPHERLKYLRNQGRILLGADIMFKILQNPLLIPPSWKEASKGITFDGTIVTSPPLQNGPRTEWMRGKPGIFGIMYARDKWCLRFYRFDVPTPYWTTKKGWPSSESRSETLLAAVYKP